MKLTTSLLLYVGMPAFFAGPHALGCATTSSTTWELTRPIATLASRDEIRRTCGGTESCQALCDALVDREFEDAKLTELCDVDTFEQTHVKDCEPRGSDVLIKCDGYSEDKGCHMPDS